MHIGNSGIILSALDIISVECASCVTIAQQVSDSVSLDAFTILSGDVNCVRDCPSCYCSRWAGWKEEMEFPISAGLCATLVG